MRVTFASSFKSRNEQTTCVQSDDEIQNGMAGEDRQRKRLSFGKNFEEGMMSR